MAIRIPEAEGTVGPPQRARWDVAHQHAALLRTVRLLDGVPPGGLEIPVLVQMHRILLPPNHPGRGKLRDGPVVIRLNGVVHRRAPDPAGALRMTEEGLEILNRRLVEGFDPAQAPRLAGIAWFNVTEPHPFPDGNGRVARALATWILVRHGYALLMDPGTYCQRHQAAHYEALRRSPVDPGAWWRFFDPMLAYCFQRVA